MNRGNFRHKIEVWEHYTRNDETDALGELVRSTRKIAETFAKIESRISSLLSGNRPADTVVQKTTMKMSVLCKNIPPILPARNFIIWGKTKFEIDYTIDTDGMGIILEIFCHEVL